MRTEIGDDETGDDVGVVRELREITEGLLRLIDYFSISFALHATYLKAYALAPVRRCYLVVAGYTLRYCRCTRSYRSAVLTTRRSFNDLYRRLQVTVNTWVFVVGNIEYRARDIVVLGGF